MTSIIQVAEALKSCRVNPCDAACEKCAYKGKTSCVEKMHREALTYLWLLGSKVLALDEKGNGQGAKN